MSIALKQVFNKDKTFRPKRKFEPGTQRFELHKRAQATLHSGVDLKAAVQLPRGEDQNDWVAVHVVDFFNRINLIYGTICEFCTERTCPVMSGGPKYEYRWQDDMKYKKPTALPAPQYMNLLMDWIEMQINNEDIFPTSVEGDDNQVVPLKSHSLKKMCPVSSLLQSSRTWQPLQNESAFNPRKQKRWELQLLSQKFSTPVSVPNPECAARSLIRATWITEGKKNQLHINPSSFIRDKNLFSRK
ncbi:MOB kinase activator 3B isoform X1 [Gallus gallus]|uniref:MOB kinase activator 3B isoform X1 n=1 Tax=Gallus gallus TaxID=9031 RepID=UPI001AEB8DF9|nr:MOB kinase activator 3B isoform X1 [Gallus gallus]XP_004949647.2 MOB kinase activator 3B isoform X1 [Gallus gallus]XP_004949648.2 MOB kinase activator 3B isoform X1 [Gallus gallus]XP_025000646.2 MOB kinase activator 3B isoform X1 [Gallus gallus]XP_025000650.2 MOB kinase activator 3B isoform X1 [Gallus gallus]XP_025000651.2 MOB kinase activator 3B isoform X1 [Gallus gallus]XP_025000652.2 MOB kinase activator 3B isoform X1 [Gallus gallus]XP_046793115.1 MOB kinase activator 3B isoform X1 [Ga